MRVSRVSSFFKSFKSLVNVNEQLAPEKRTRLVEAAAQEAEAAHIPGGVTLRQILLWGSDFGAAQHQNAAPDPARTYSHHRPPHGLSANVVCGTSSHRDEHAI